MTQATAPGKTSVLLLKTKSTPRDGYEEYFTSFEDGTYVPTFVPVLEHKFNELALQQIMTWIEYGCFANSHKAQTLGVQYGGLIFTSQRAVEAFHTIVENLRTTEKEGGQLVSRVLPDNLPLYVVGPATAKSVRAIGLPCPVFGEETGNGEILAHFILDHYNQLAQAKLPDGTNRSLLFMVGEQRRDIIPKTLQSDCLEPARQIKVIETEVYVTGVMERFPDEFKDAIHPAVASGENQWVIVFSPTGCKAMLEGLHLLDPATGKAIPRRQDRTTFIATIGPTTRDYLRREFDVEPDVCAAKPSPEGMGQGILAFLALEKP
ncbi:hypothetical protein FH972_022895 [Carpinus fangiana]|uniref:Tetrapyrrole biosynthesis uroporphyrinogen III synthase domain-containing protein n=1 Tax=Carpinus fangiana TaxID=176857 RepID=A0A5N6KTK4_9ROSI|nr:hypothetical protein FH972_022895 [Carpinus fangiana]